MTYCGINQRQQLIVFPLVLEKDWFAHVLDLKHVGLCVAQHFIGRNFNFHKFFNNIIRVFIFNNLKNLLRE